MPVTSCDYVLFGECYCQNTLRDVLRHVLRKLNQMDPGELRACARKGRFPWLAFDQGTHLEEELRRSQGNLHLHPDLWASVRWVTRQNLEPSCRQLIEGMGYPEYAFTVVAFGDWKLAPERGERTRREV